MPTLSNYAYAVTMDEMLEIAIHHLEEVRHSDNFIAQGVHLKMASLALQAAMHVYVKEPKESVTHDQI